MIRPVSVRRSIAWGVVKVAFVVFLAVLGFQTATGGLK